MKNGKKIEKIKCPIFQAKNKIIERKLKEINEAVDIKQKEIVAQKLLNEVEDLLSCEDFNKKKFECEICHYIAKLRQRTANLIIKARDLR